MKSEIKIPLLFFLHDAIFFLKMCPNFIRNFVVIRLLSTFSRLKNMEKHEKKSLYQPMAFRITPMIFAHI